MSSTDCSDEEDVVAYYHFRRRKTRKNILGSSISRKNIRCRLFVVAWKLVIVKHWMFLNLSHKFNV
jgi:hypothetical protein